MAFLAALSHLANVGTFVNVGQEHAHQREQVRWNIRNYALDMQALKIDLLGEARDDVRGTYQTYAEQLDTALLLNALLLPFAPGILQLSDDFVPPTEDECPYCIEAHNPWLNTCAIYMIGFCLILPFWALLMLLRCKIWLDNWLQNTLDKLQGLRRMMILHPPHDANTPNAANINMRQADTCNDQEQILVHLTQFVGEYQDLFLESWTRQCAPLFYLALRLLLSSVIMAVMLIGLLLWMYLKNRQGQQNIDNVHFLWLIIAGLLVPVIYFLRQCSLKQQSVEQRCAAAPSLGEQAPPT